MNSLSKALEPMFISKRRFGLLILIILMQLLILYAFIQGEMLIVLSVILGLAFFLFSIFSVERSFYLMIFYYLAFSEKTYAYYFKGWIPFVWYIGLPLFIWLLGNWLIYLIRKQIPNETQCNEVNKIPRISFSTMDKLLLIFFSAFTISAFIGFLRDFNRKYWMYEYLGLLMYSGYFIYLYSPLSKNHRRLFDFVVFCSTIVSIQFINSLIQFGGVIVLRRIVSTHIHIAQLTIPYLGTIILYTSSKLRRILSIILFPIVLVGVIICQQRALWASVFVTLIILLLIFTYDKRQLLIRHATKIIYVIIGIIIFFGGLYILLQILTQGKLLPTMFTRILFFISPQMAKYDISAITRISEIKIALSTVGNDFLFGRGLGDAIISRWRDIEGLTVDNSFAYLYWKTGFFGLFSFIILFLYFLYRCISTLRKKLMTEEKIYVLTAFLNIAGLIIVAFTNASIVHYRYIIVWAATFAVVESIARKYDKPTILKPALNEKSIK